MPLRHKEARVDFASCRAFVSSYKSGLCYSIAQLQIIVAPIDKTHPVFDLQTDNIFGGNGRAKVNKFLACIKKYSYQPYQYAAHFYLSITYTLFLRVIWRVIF